MTYAYLRAFIILACETFLLRPPPMSAQAKEKISSVPNDGWCTASYNLRSIYLISGLSRSPDESVLGTDVLRSKNVILCTEVKQNDTNIELDQYLATGIAFRKRTNSMQQRKIVLRAVKFYNLFPSGRGVLVHLAALPVLRSF